MDASMEEMSHFLKLMLKPGVLSQQVSTAGTKMSVCASCSEKVPSSGNNKCGGCKRVAYCSRDCQVSHWNGGHKKACKALAAMFRSQKKVPVNGRTWKDYVKEKKLRRELWLAGSYGKETHLESFFIDEPYCCHCFRIAAQVESEGLRVCQSCGFHNFCADCPQTHDEYECSVFRMALEDEKMITTLGLKTLRPWISVISNKPSTKYEPLSSSPDWYARWGFTLDSQPVPASLRTEGPWSSSDIASLWRLNSHNMTNSYTVLAALEKVLPDLASRKALTLHVLGAGKEEIAPREPYESILHELAALKQLDIFFIGPDVTDPAARAHLGHYLVCQNCSKVGKTLNLSYWAGLYHDFVKTQLYTKPDIAAAQQSGFPFGMEKEMNLKNSNSWTPTIKHLLKASHPTVFTSMNKDEMVTETAVLRKLRANFIQKGEVNKWHSMAPINEGWYRPGVFYRNHYWYIIGPKCT